MSTTRSWPTSWFALVTSMFLRTVSRTYHTTGIRQIYDTFRSIAVATAFTLKFDKRLLHHCRHDYFSTHNWQRQTWGMPPRLYSDIEPTKLNFDSEMWVELVILSLNTTKQHCRFVALAKRDPNKCNVYLILTLSTNNVLVEPEIHLSASLPANCYARRTVMIIFSTNESLSS